jgi:hypothetical protein
MLNNPDARSAHRQPRALVRLNDAIVPGWVSWTVANNTFYEADTFRVSFAASALPASNNAAWFAGQRETFAEILAGFPSDPANPLPFELMSLIYGRVDHIEYDPVATLITLTGRDLTAAFIDAKLSKDYANQRSSDVAASLAAAHGLTPVVTQTRDRIGTYYKHDQVRMQADRSEWDLLAWLSREEGFVCYVSGRTLYFGPDPRSTDNPYVIQWQPPSAAGGAPVSNVMELSFSRSQTVAKGVAVTVRSPSLTKKTPVVQSYPSAPKAIQAGQASPFGNVQPYYYTVAAGQTAVQVQQYAQRKYQEIISHEMKLRARLPADDLLTVATPIRVTGTGTAWDQLYYPREITREMAIDEGYSMTVEAQNHSDDQVPAA